MRHTLRRAAQRPDAGFTLVEVVVACVILGILSAVVLAFILQTQSQSVTNRSRIAASNLAARELDMVREEFHRKDQNWPAVIEAQTSSGQPDGTVVNPHPLDGGVDGQPLVVNATPFTVTRSSHWNLTTTGTSTCDGGSLQIYPTLQVTVSVTWPHMGSVRPVVSSAQLAPDKGQGIPSVDSFIAVRAVDQSLQPLVETPIVVTGGAQSASGSTDADGCAVIEVSPATGLGTAYTAKASGAGLVDVNNVLNPTVSIGKVPRGQLATAKFGLAQGGTVTIRLTDPSHTVIPAAQAAGKHVILFAPDSAGNKTSPQVINNTSSSVTVANLWPGRYAAYFGDSVPTDSDTVPQTLEPGGSLVLDAVMAPATGTFSNLPAGTTSVVAMPNSATTCCGGGVTVPTTGFSLIPGAWSFFASGSDGGHPFTNSPGPGTGGGTAVTLVGGDNGDFAWGTTGLHFTGTSAPTGMPLYALAQATAGNLGTACPAPGLDASAFPLSATGTTPLPAGTYYVYARNTATTCKQPISASPAANYYLFTVSYGQDNALSWPSHLVAVTIRGIESLRTKNGGTVWPYVYLTSTNSATNLTCAASGITAKAGYTATLVGQATGSSLSAGNLGEGTYYLWGNDPGTNPTWGTVWSPPNSCKWAGTIVIQSTTTTLSTSADYYNTTTHPTVGP